MAAGCASARAGAVILGLSGLLSATVFAGLAYGTYGGLIIALALGEIKSVAAY